MKKETVNSFYDSIADEYESQLTANDKHARSDIATFFRSCVTSGKILDFGGGTGLDLPWLLESFKEVHFFEPAEKMRSVAKGKDFKNNLPLVVEEGLDFKLWRNDALPFKTKFEGILANFAVVNCIDDLNLFFEKMALVAEKKSHFVITMIAPQFLRVAKNYSLWVAIKLFINQKLLILNRNNGLVHETYLYTLEEIELASNPHFILNKWKKIKSSNFVTIDLVRK